MKKVRFWLIGLLVWFFFLFNIERMNEPINIASFVYVFTVGCVLIIMLSPALQKMPFYWPTLMALPPYFFLKALFRYEIGGANLPITVTEICAIGITIFLTAQIGRRLDSLQEAVTSLTIDQLYKRTHSFETGQGPIYREIRRARNYHRPAALLAISVTEDSLNQSLDRFVQEAQREILKKYVAARVANFLVEELQDTDVIAKRNDHFITLLPEISRENVAKVVARLEAAGKEKLGLSFEIGASTFPDEAVTFERLLERAEVKMFNSGSGGHSRVEVAPASRKGILQT